MNLKSSRIYGIGIVTALVTDSKHSPDLILCLKELAK